MPLPAASNQSISIHEYVNLTVSKDPIIVLDSGYIAIAPGSGPGVPYDAVTNADFTNTTTITITGSYIMEE